MVTDYKVRGLRSGDNLERRLRLHLTPFFGGRRAAGITADPVRQFISQRQDAGASNGEVNRELATLKRAFTLGMQSAKILHRPHIPMLLEDNVRTGFFEREQFEAVRAKLPSPSVQNLLTFAYVTGWRVKSEIQPLQWRQVDFEGQTVRLDAGTTKNRAGRVFPFTAELRAVLQGQLACTRQVERRKGIVCPWVFHRSGQPIRYFRRTWVAACTRRRVAQAGFRTI